MTALDTRRLVVIPAIDVRDGRCVRLKQGDFARQTVYGDDPVEMARRWEAEGASRIHVVDLDGAREGVRQNALAIGQVLAAVRVPVQVGGGVRSLDVASELIDQGADRVIVGSAAAEQPERVAEWVAGLTAERLVVGVDARHGKVAIHGWVETTAIDAASFCRRLADAGVRRVLYTDIGRDGMAGGPNVAMTRAIVEQGRLRVIGSGGVSAVEHLEQLAAAGAEAAIVGTALYDGRLGLAELLRRFECGDQ